MFLCLPPAPCYPVGWYARCTKEASPVPAAIGEARCRDQGKRFSGAVGSFSDLH